MISIHDIGTCYAQDISNENVTKFNYVMYVYLTDNPTYLYDIEKSIMTILIIEYDNENEKNMGYIARLVTNRKNDNLILFYYNISIVYRHLFFIYYKDKKHYIQREKNSSVENVKAKDIRRNKEG